MTDRENRDPLDENLAELLRRAPERATLTDEARARIAERLRGRALELAPAGAPAALRQRARAGAWISLAAAAAILVAVAAALFMRSGAAPDLRERAVADGAPPPAAAPNDGTATERPDGDARVPAGDGASAPDAPGDASEVDVGDPAADVLGWLDIPEDLRAEVAEVTLWTRPVVELPRVAEARRETVALPADGPARIPFRAAGARERARRTGAPAVLVQVEVPGIGSVRQTIDATGDGPVALLLARGAVATGTVIDAATGAPVEGALVVPVDQLPLDTLDVHQAPGPNLPRPWALTDALGRFRLEGVTFDPPPTLRASRAGFAPEHVRAAVAAPGAPPTLEATIELGPGGALEGLVERADGTRFEGAFVVASRAPEGPASARTRLPMTFGRSETDALGRYSIDDISPGNWIVLVFDPNAGQAAPPLAFRAAEIEREVTTTIDFLSSPSAAGLSLAGTLRGPDGAPAPGEALAIAPTDGAADDWSATTTALDGTFRFDGLARGEHTLLRGEDDFRRLSLVWSGAVDGPTAVEVELPANAIVCRVASRVAGAAVGPDWLLLERLAEESLDGARERWDFAGSSSVADGEVRFTSLPPGRYRAAAVAPAPDLGVGFSEPFDLDATGTATASIAIPRGGVLALSVVDANGAPVAGAAVTAHVVGAGRPVPSRDPILTDADGRATIPGVPTGEIEVRVTAPDGGTLARPHRFEAGPEPAPLEVVLGG